MRVAEEHPAPGECVEMRGAGIRVPAEAPDPVVQVVDGDEKDVGFGTFGFHFENLSKKLGKENVVNDI